MPWRASLALLFTCLVAGCATSQAGVHNPQNAPLFGPGMVLRYHYPLGEEGADFEVTIEDTSHLRWRGVSGPVEGMESRVEYTRRDIAPGVVLLSWVEPSGSVMAQLIDLVGEEVHAIEAPGDGQRVQVDGTLEILEPRR